jgi:predicted nuclease with TOPRIM domain
VDVVTALVSIAGSGSVAVIATSLLSLPKSARVEMRELRDDLTECQGNCAEAKDEARRARIETDEWKRLHRRIEEDSDRWQKEAEHWRRRWEELSGDTDG